jgi:hypothetical protein
MNKILIEFAHPAFQKSRINSQLVAAPKICPELPLTTYTKTTPIFSSM